MEPRDTLFRWTFSQLEHAAGLLKVALPPDLTRAFDWSTLRLVKVTFVTMRSRQSDLVFSIVAAGQPLFVCVLVEHSRKLEVMMVLRGLDYRTELWAQYLRRHPGARTLPRVVPTVLLNRAEGWTAVTGFEDPIAVGRAALEQHIPRSETRRIDIDTGRASREGGTATADGLAVLEALVRYLAATHQHLSAEKVGKPFEKAMGPQGQEAVVTFLDEIEARGEAKGKREGKLEGKLEGKREALLDLLAARFGRVPARVQARIRAADEGALGRWTVRVLTASTAAEAIGDDAGGRGVARAASTKRAAVANRRAAATSKRA